MAIWLTRPDLGDPATLAHANTPDPYGRPNAPACGVSAHGLRYHAAIEWEDVPVERRCAACMTALT